MGANQSAERKKEYEAELLMLRTKAGKMFNKRLQEYNFAYHGDYGTYLYTIQALHELECIPEYLRSGNSKR